MSSENTPKYYQESLLYHQRDGRPGKVAMIATKPLMTQEDLSLAYSPGVAAPCLAIAKDVNKIYDYTARGNSVAVITNGTAVLGLGNIGAAASKPVMEGKSALFKRFADIDGIDIEVNTADANEFINAVKHLGYSFGGINLEDIKAPECFVIEDELKKLMDIPVFHDDQHGTAIIVAAGLINALDLTNKQFSTIRVVVNGAGAAGMACVDLLKSFGVKSDNVILCDTKGVIYHGRSEGMNPWKEKHAAHTTTRTLSEALEGADVFLGLSSKDALSQDMLKLMAPNPIIFAMANPDPEITPNKAYEIRPDAIVATGRSDYNNQINNVMCFPYIFRGALDVRAKTINVEMKIAAAKALALLAREPVSEDVRKAYNGKKMTYGRDYLIPVPFDPRLIYTIPVAVAKAAIETNVAAKPIADLELYRKNLEHRGNPSSYYMSNIFDAIKASPQKIIIAEGEEEEAIKAAITIQNNGYAKPILVGRMHKITPILQHIGYEGKFDIEVINASNVTNLPQLIDGLYTKLQRQGYIYRDCAKLVKTNKNIFAACLVASGYADGVVTGITNNYHNCLNELTSILTPKKGVAFSYSIFVSKDSQLLIADSSVNDSPTAEQLAEIAIQLADMASTMGLKPRIAMLSSSNFGSRMNAQAATMQDAVKLLDSKKVAFEYDGEMSAEVALSPSLLKLYPFCRLSDAANVLIMPNLSSANIATQMLNRLTDGTLIGPILSELSSPAQIVHMRAASQEVVMAVAFSAIEAIKSKSK